MALAIETVAREGKVLVVGDYGTARADFAWNDVLHNELELIGSNASAGAWEEAVALATGGEVPLDRFISHRLPAREFARGIELARMDRDALKVLLDWRMEQS